MLTNYKLIQARFDVRLIFICIFFFLSDKVDLISEKVYLSCEAVASDFGVESCQRPRLKIRFKKQSLLMMPRMVYWMEQQMQIQHREFMSINDS